MKRYLFCLALAGCAALLQAADYKYLVLQRTDGTTVDLLSEGLSLTFSDGQLVASDGTTVALSALSQMYFSDESTGVEGVAQDAVSGPVTIFSATGSLLGSFDSAPQARKSLPRGVYVMRCQGGKTLKIAVK